jgi:hypothetical protein
MAGLATRRAGSTAREASIFVGVVISSPVKQGRLSAPGARETDLPPGARRQLMAKSFLSDQLRFLDESAAGATKQPRSLTVGFYRTASLS